ncbi:MAG: FUSC family protein [Bacteroidetes bacterium]|nr:FUSC family protein [Bacteroidota bacterium]
MDYIRQYKSFVNSHYLSEGIRITVGLTLPAILLSYFNHLSAGITMSLGASCVIIVDNAGPIHHRRNAMIICDALIFLVTLLIGFILHLPIFLGVVIALLCFIFSMIGVYGSRASSIGLAALLVMIYSIGGNSFGGNVFINALNILMGGVWYTLLSLALYSFRPYKLAQQALGDCIQATATFLRTKASFYNNQTNYDKNYQELLEQQVSVHEKQNLVRELLFKSRSIIKDTTPIGRILVMLFLDIVDLFERVLSTQHDYTALHQAFDKSDILLRFQQMIMEMAGELDEIGIAVKAGKVSEINSSLNTHIKELRSYFNDFRDQQRTAANVENFIDLRHILETIEDIGDRLYTLHSYTTYDHQLAKKSAPPIDYEKFITHQDIDFKLLRDNLTLQSNIFRHALRVCVATTIGYSVSKFFPLGHSYWILLTIIVILKPAYSLTKKRNYDRLIGTISGAVIGLTILYFTKDKDVIFGFMIAFMIGSYSFMRTRYLIFVLLMTPYILLLFYLLNPANFKTIITDRIIDTTIGSVIAFVANIFLLPAWEDEQFTDYLIEVIEANTTYLLDVTGRFTGRPFSVTQYKLSRKQAFVALGNLSDAFNRMLSEPKRKQKNIRVANQFVVLNHMLTSHIATLSSYAQKLAEKYQSQDFLPIIKNIQIQMNAAKATLQNEPLRELNIVQKESLRVLNDKVTSLMEKRKSELDGGIIETDTKKNLGELKFIADQFNFITKIATDIEKLSKSFALNAERQTPNAS